MFIAVVWFVQDSARSVGEEIDAADDDSDIVSPSGTSGQADLGSSRKSDHKEKDHHLHSDVGHSSSNKHAKGNVSLGHNSAYTAVELGKKSKGDGNGSNKELTAEKNLEDKNTDMASSTGASANSVKEKKKDITESGSEEKKTDSKAHELKPGVLDEDEALSSARMVTSVRSDRKDRSRDRKEPDNKEMRESGKSELPKKTLMLEDIFRPSRPNASYLAAMAKEFAVNTAYEHESHKSHDLEKSSVKRTVSKPREEKSGDTIEPSEADMGKSKQAAKRLRKITDENAVMLCIGDCYCAWGFLHLMSLLYAVMFVLLGVRYML